MSDETSAPIETVDANELAALERAAQERDRINLPPIPGAAQMVAAVDKALAPGLGVHPAVTGPTKLKARDATEAAAMSAGPTLTPIYTVGPDGKVQPFIEASAVDQRLVALEANLAHVTAMLRHTMLLAMILADRFAVSQEEWTRAKALTEQQERGGK